MLDPSHAEVLCDEGVRIQLRHINWRQLIICAGELGGFVIEDAQESTLGLKDGIKDRPSA